MDKLLDNIRMGDNVVMQVSDLKDFKKMAEAFVCQAIKDKRNILYIRFAKHQPLLEPQEGLKIIELSASKGFECFSGEVHELIGREGKDAFYVFDCLSDLQVVWSTDLMMGNFFCVTCPYLYELNTVAYFPVLLGHHDYAAIARIQETTQLLLNIHSNDEDTYLHPIKVWNRYSQEMYLPHRKSGEGEFEALCGSVDMADYYRLIHTEGLKYAEQNMDSYERFFKEAKDSFYKNTITKNTLHKITLSMMTHDRKMADMIQEQFSPEDYFFIKERVIGTGTIGGKACGMLIARKIIENKLPKFCSRIEPHDSFYIGTDVFYSFIVENKLWKLRMQQRKEENYFIKGEELSKALLSGQFSENIRMQFKRMLEYFGQIPIIVRSSSFLEDGFGNAFAGKYESVFCANGGSPEERLENFENAVRRVYSSTLNPSALEYRRKRGMAEADEQMAILVQRVSGTRFGDFYMPCIAGVGFSYSVYRWSSDLTADAGLLRLVAGLGTKAVDRTGTDYPRLVNLDKPESTTLVNEREKHRYCQRKLDVIHTKYNRLTELNADELIPQLPKWYVDLICERDTAAERSLSERGQFRPVQFISCEGVVKNAEVMTMLKEIMAVLQEKYATPVDIEYTVNFNPDGAFAVNILQCRPLYVWQSAAAQTVPQISDNNILLTAKNTFMGNSAKIAVDAVVFIDSQSYHACPYNQKSSVAKIVGQINGTYKDSGKNLMLISPGRIGTSSPELGVTVTFSDISNFKILCEYADPEIGFVPELSFGSHMFQDIVENEMFYIAVMDKAEDTFLRKDFFEGNSLLQNIVSDAESFSDIVKVYEIEKADVTLFADYENQKVICGIVETEQTI